MTYTPRMLGACSEHACSNAPILSSPILSSNRCRAQGEYRENSERENLAAMLASGPVEIRANDGDKWWSGIFDDYASLARSGRFAHSKGMNVYTSLNPCALPITNRIKPYSKAVRDDDVTRICRLPFDLDPNRETGEAATDRQLGYAEDRLRVLVDLLSDWGNPLIGMSGNGYHAQYFVDLPNDDETKAAMVGLYRGLRVRLSTAEVSFDVTVKNPSRIFRMYGTTNQKSGRRTWCRFPSNPEVIPAEVFFDTAEKLTPPKPKPAPSKVKRVQAVGHKHYDIVSLFRSLGLYKRDLGGGKHAVTCPDVDRHSSSDHASKTDTVIWDGEWPQFHCSHAHCEALDIYEVLDRYA